MADAGGKLGSTTYWYVVLFWFGIGFGFGIEFTCTWNEMIVFAFGFIGSIAIPLAGLTLGSVFPFTVTLLGINDVPFGITSVNITFDASVFPLFVKVVVYVIISFTLANCLSADLVAAIEALLIVVCTVLEATICITAGLDGSYVYWNVVLD
ncbi:hypothetical protein BACERE00187_04986 [Bacillus cereus]|nr:hypothetical protein B4155_0395 [Bacillus cereus]SME38470.1 hypothetical protein BACERE00187_04986 [Bacillus cereus]